MSVVPITDQNTAIEERYDDLVVWGAEWIIGFRHRRRSSTAALRGFTSPKVEQCVEARTITDADPQLFEATMNQVALPAIAEGLRIEVSVDNSAMTLIGAAELIFAEIVAELIERADVTGVGDGCRRAAAAGLLS